MRSRTVKAQGVGFLRVEAGNLARTTHVSAECVHREVALSRCPITSWTVKGPEDVNKLRKDSFSEGQLLELSVTETMPGDVLWNEDPEKIGVVDADQKCGRIILPPHAFAAIWSAAEATVACRRSVELELKIQQREILAITNVGFFEAVLRYDTVAEGDAPRASDQILVELMRKELIPLIRSATFWLFVMLGLLGVILIWTSVESHRSDHGEQTITLAEKYSEWLLSLRR